MGFFKNYVRKDNHYSPANVWSLALLFPVLLIPVAEVVLPIFFPELPSIPDYILPVLLGGALGLVTGDVVHQNKRENEETKRCAIDKKHAKKVNIPSFTTVSKTDIPTPPTASPVEFQDGVYVHPEEPKRKPKPHPSYEG